jgi:hypothetical protein
MDTSLAVLSYAGTATVAFLVGNALKPFLSGYSARKGENLATKEDVAGITQLVKEVEHKFDMITERFRETSALRLAAVERRLQAHQEAFSLWRQLLAVLHKRDRGDSELAEKVVNCQTWWENNCLYLSPEARLSFVDAYQAALDYQHFVQRHRYASTAERIKEALKSQMETWKRISEAGNVLLESMDLPPLKYEDDMLMEPPKTEGS